MALTVAGQGAPKSMTSASYRSLMLGKSPTSTKAAKPVNTDPYDASGRMVQPTASKSVGIDNTKGGAGAGILPGKPVVPPTGSSALPAITPPPAAGPANQPPGQPVVPPPSQPPAASTGIDNTKGGAGAGTLPGKPVVPPTSGGVPANQPPQQTKAPTQPSAAAPLPSTGPANQGPGATGGGTSKPLTFPPAQKKAVTPLAPTQSYNTAFDPSQYRSTATAPGATTSYRTQRPANQPGAGAGYRPIQLSTTPGQAYPTGRGSQGLYDEFGRMRPPPLSTAVTTRPYSTQGPANQPPQTGGSERLAVPRAMSYTIPQAANQPPPPGVGAGNRLSTTPTHGYGTIELPKSSGGFLPQPSFRDYRGALPPPPPVGGFTPSTSPYDAGGRMVGPGGYDPGAGARMQAAQGTGYDPGAGARMQAGQGSGPSYQEIMARQQTQPFLPGQPANQPPQGTGMSLDEYVRLTQGGGTRPLSPQQLMALRQSRGGY